MKTMAVPSSTKYLSDIHSPLPQSSMVHMKAHRKAVPGHSWGNNQNPAMNPKILNSTGKLWS
jgi:hypothetical protein